MSFFKDIGRGITNVAKKAGSGENLANFGTGYGKGMGGILGGMLGGVGSGVGAVMDGVFSPNMRGGLDNILSHATNLANTEAGVGLASALSGVPFIGGGSGRTELNQPTAKDNNKLYLMIGGAVILLGLLYAIFQKKGRR